ncbi:Ank2, partial [Symbiodinium sp. CCMP2456]
VGDARSLKRYLQSLCGVPRFRQRLIADGRALEDDFRRLEAGDIQLVLLSFCEASDAEAGELHLAAREGRVSEVEEMLSRPLHPDSTSKEVWYTPLYAASHRGDVEMVRLLLEASADKDDTRCHGFTPLGIACVLGRANVASVLLEAGVDKDKDCTWEGATPLGAAADHGREETVRLMLEAGADKEKPWGDGMTPLGAAALKGRVKAARLLLDAGAEKDCRCQGGATPLGLASSRGFPTIVQMLLKAGADKDACRRDGTTPLGVAARKGAACHRSMVQHATGPLPVCSYRPAPTRTSQAELMGHHLWASLPAREMLKWCTCC